MKASTREMPVADHMPNNIIYFEAQTGITRDQPSAVSSFYQYAIQVTHRAELEEAIAAATPGRNELQYAPGFVRRSKYEMMWIDSFILIQSMFGRDNPHVVVAFRSCPSARRGCPGG